MSTLSMTRGDTGVWRFTCTDQDDAVVDLTGAAVTFTVRPDPMGAVVLEQTLDDGVAIVVAVDGTLDVTIGPSAGLQARTYKWDLEVAYGPDEIFTVDYGLLHVAQDVTYTAGS